MANLAATSFNWSKFYGINERVDIDFNDLVGLGPGGLQFPTSGGKGDLLKFGGNPKSPNKRELNILKPFAGLKAGLAAELGYDYGAKLDLGSANARLQSGVNITLEGDFASFGDTSKEPDFKFSLDTVPTQLDWNLVTPEFRAWAYLTYAAGIDLDYFWQIPLPRWVEKITGEIGDSGNLFQWDESGRSGYEVGYSSTTLSGSSTISSLKQLERQMLGSSQPAWSKEILPYVNLKFFSPAVPSPQTTSNGFSLGSKFPILEISGDLDRAISALTGIPFSGNIDWDYGVGYLKADWSLIDVDPVLRLYGYYDLALKFAIDTVEIWSAEPGNSTKLVNVKPGDISSGNLAADNIAKLLKGIALPDTNNNKQFDFEIRWNPKIALTPKLGFTTDLGYHFGALNAGIDLGVDLDFGWLGSWSDNWDARVDLIPREYTSLFKSDTPINIPGLTGGRKEITPSWLKEIRVPLQIPRGLTDATLYDLETRLGWDKLDRISLDGLIDVPSLADTTETSTINISESIATKLPFDGLGIKLPENNVEISIPSGNIPLLVSLPSFGEISKNRLIDYTFPGFTLNSKPVDSTESEPLPPLNRADKLIASPSQSATIEYSDERCQDDTIEVDSRQVMVDLSCGNDELKGSIERGSVILMGEGDDKVSIEHKINSSDGLRNGSYSGKFDDARYARNGYKYTHIDLGSGSDQASLPTYLDRTEIAFNIDGNDKISAKPIHWYHNWYDSRVTAVGNRASGREISLSNRIVKIPRGDSPAYYLIDRSDIKTEEASAAITFLDTTTESPVFEGDTGHAEILIDYSSFEPESLSYDPNNLDSWDSEDTSQEAINNWSKGIFIKLADIIVDISEVQASIEEQPQEKDGSTELLTASDFRVDIVGTNQDDTFVIEGYASRIIGGGGDDKYVLNSPYSITNFGDYAAGGGGLHPIGFISDDKGESTVEIHDAALDSFYTHGIVTYISEYGSRYSIEKRSDSMPFEVLEWELDDDGARELELDEVGNLLETDSNWNLDLSHLSERPSDFTVDSRLFYQKKPINMGYPDSEDELWGGQYQPTYVKLPKTLTLPDGNNFFNPSDLFGKLVEPVDLFNPDALTTTNHVPERYQDSDQHVLMPFEHILDQSNHQLTIKLGSGSDEIYGYSQQDIFDLSGLSIDLETGSIPSIGTKKIIDNNLFDDDTIILPRSLDELILETSDQGTRIIRFKSDPLESYIEFEAIENIVADGITFETDTLFDPATMPLLVRGIPSTLISRNLSTAEAKDSIERLLKKKILIQSSDLDNSGKSNDPDHLIKLDANNPDLATITIPKEVLTSAIQTLDGTQTSLSFPYDESETNPLAYPNEFGYPSLRAFEEQAVALPADALTMVSNMGFSEEQWNIYRNVLATNTLNTTAGGYSFSRNIANTTIEGRYIFSPIGKQEAVNTLKSVKSTLGLTGVYSSPVPTTQFIASPATQEIYLAALALANHKRFITSKANGNYYKSLPTEEQLGLLTYAHNEGFSAAESFLSTGRAAVRSGIPVTNFRDHLLYESELRKPLSERSPLEQLVYSMQKEEGNAQPTLDKNGNVVVHLTKELTRSNPEDSNSSLVYDWPLKISFDYRLSTAGGKSYDSTYDIYIVDQSNESVTAKTPEEEGLEITPKLGSGVVISNEAVLKVDDKNNDKLIRGDELELDLNGNKIIDPFEKLPATDILATGIIRFDLELTEVQSKQSVDIEIVLQNPVKANSYRKWYIDEWIDFSYDPTKPKEGGAELIDRNKDGLIEKIILHVSDNERGDNNPAIGFVEDPGVLVFSDTTAPTVTALSVNGSKLTISLSEAVNSTIPAAKRFSILVNGITREIKSASVNNSDKTISLDLVSPVKAGQRVTLAYNDASKANDTSEVIEDVNGNDLASFAARSVINNTEKEAISNQPPTSISVRLKRKSKFKQGKTIGFIKTKDPDGDDNHTYGIEKAGKKKFSSGKFFSVKGNRLVFSANKSDVSAIRKFRLLLSTIDQAGDSLRRSLKFANPLFKSRGSGISRRNSRQNFETDIHNKNVSEALPFLSNITLEAIADTQHRVDSIFFPHQYKSANHFDNNNFIGSTREINSRYNSLMKDIISNSGKATGFVRPPRPARTVANPNPKPQPPFSPIWDQFGKIVHAVQDFYAHTNWIELGFDPVFDYKYLGGKADPQILFDTSYTYLAELKPGFPVGKSNIVPITFPGSQGSNAIQILGPQLGSLNAIQYDLNHDGKIDNSDKKFYWVANSSRPFAIAGTTTSGKDIGALSSGIGAPYLYGQSDLTDIALETIVSFNRSLVTGETKSIKQPWLFEMKGFDHGGLASVYSIPISRLPSFLANSVSPNNLRLDEFKYSGSPIQKNDLELQDFSHPIQLGMSVNPEINEGLDFWKSFPFTNVSTIRMANKDVEAGPFNKFGAFLGPLSKDKADSPGSDLAKDLSNRQIQHEFVRTLYMLDAINFDVVDFAKKFFNNSTEDQAGLTASDRFVKLMSGENSMFDSLTGLYLNNGIPTSNEAQRKLDSEIINYLAGRSILSTDIPKASFSYNSGDFIADTAPDKETTWIIVVDTIGATVEDVKVAGQSLLAGVNNSIQRQLWGHYLHQFIP